MKAFEIKTFFSFTIFGVTVPITETVIISWVVMLILIVGSIILVRKLEIVPKGFQTVLEAGVELLNSYTVKSFGPFAVFLTPYLGSLFLFLLVGNIIGVISPIEIKAFGHEFVPPFMIRPPTRDINVTAAFGCISIFLVLVCGFAARGLFGWIKHLFYPIAFMLPFNIMDYGTRLLSLSLRLFGNILGGYVLMSMIEGMLPIALPMVFALYFDLFDGVVQAAIFVFLTSLYIHEAVKNDDEE